jgi:predicted dehydrogenase
MRPFIGQKQPSPQISIPSLDEILPEMPDFDNLPPTSRNAPNKPVKVAVEGLGHCFRERYFKPLLQLVRTGKIDLWLIDVREALPIEMPKEVVFLSKSRDADERIRKGLCVDVVFVVTPEATHCDVAEEWLGRAKLIVVEKPFDRSFKRALAFIERLRGYPDTLVANTDHYYIKALPFFRSHLMSSIAEPVSAKFFLLESQRIHPCVASSFNGMILDLASHGFCLWTGFGEFSNLHLQEVFAAYYKNSPIPEETFAYIPFDMEGIQSEIIVGKAHTRDQKYLQLCGSNAKKLRLDFACNQAFLKTSEGSNWIPKMSLPSNAHAYMLDHLLGDGGFREKTGLFLNLKQALQILYLLEVAQNAITQRGTYPEGDNWKNIIKALGS